MKTYVHIVPHFHWDREWYFHEEDSRILLVNDLDEILSFLQENPDYPSFTLDGQMSIIEDYLSIKPQNKPLIQRLVQQHRLIIGPCYTQSDEMVVGGESLVRNFFYGIQAAKELGDFMPIGYFPDSFGQSAQLPMILQGFGIHHCIFWRGLSQRNGLKHSEFIWESQDGSQVITLFMPLGYAIGKYLPTDKDALYERCQPIFQYLENLASSHHILLPNGHDQMPIQKNISDVISQLQQLFPDKTFLLSDYEKLFSHIHTPQDHLKGEFLDGKDMRVHRSIYSSRSDLKTKNTQIENQVTNLLEPLMSLAYVLGFDYYHHALERLWKTLLLNHAHDSMGCCCSDDVHRCIENRYDLIQHQINALLSFYQRKIADAIHIHSNSEKLVIFNLLPYGRTVDIETTLTTKLTSFELYDGQHSLPYTIIQQKEIDPGLIDRQLVHYENYEPFIEYTIQFSLPLTSMGYQTLFIRPIQDHKKMASLITYPQILKQDAIIENSFYTIQIHQNGTLSLKDKKRHKTYHHVLLLEDSGDDGDSYDYSPLQEDWIITSQDVKADIQITDTPYQKNIVIHYTLPVPHNLHSRQQKICDAVLSVSYIITVFAHQPQIHIQIQVDNQAKDHRIRLFIPTHIFGQYSLCDHQFGMIKRPIQDPSFTQWKEEQWQERPDSIYPFLSYVTIEKASLAVITNSIREYQIIDDQIALTLFRCVGYLGKDHLLRRPNRPSGIQLATPQSQLLKTLNFDIYLCGFDRADQLPQIAKNCLTSPLIYQKKSHDALKMNTSAFLPQRFSLFTQWNPALTMSTLKKAEHQEGLILRVFHTTNQPQPFIIDTKIEATVNLNEEAIAYQAYVPPYHALSYRLRFPKEHIRLLDKPAK